MLAAEPGGPAPTVEVVKKLVGNNAVDENTAKEAKAAEAEVEGETEQAKDKVEVEEPSTSAEEKKKEDESMADVAADVADSAAKVDEDHDV